MLLKINILTRSVNCYIKLKLTKLVTSKCHQKGFLNLLTNSLQDLFLKLGLIFFLRLVEYD